MKRLLLLLLAMLALTGLALIVGCSDDDGDGDGNPMISGDENDPSFMFFNEYASDMAGETSEMALMGVFGMIEYLQSAKGAGAFKAANDMVISNYSYVDGWHTCSYTATFVDSFYDGGTVVETLWVEGIDSLQTWVDGAPIQTPQSQPDSLVVRTFFDAEMQNTAGGSAVANGTHVFSMAALAPNGEYERWQIDGAAYDTLAMSFEDDSSNTCDMTVYVLQGYDALAIDMGVMENDGCPTGGSLNALIGVSLTCSGSNSPFDELTVEGNWTVLEEFDGSSVTRTISYDNTVWTQTYSCD